MSESLFEEFSPVTAAAWKQKIQVDLKGADYNQSLLWQSLEGIHVKPFYHQDDFPQGIPKITNPPTNWNAVQAIFIDDETIANHLIINTINRGAEAVKLSFKKAFNLETLFKDFPFEATTIYFDIQFLEIAFLENLIGYLQSKKATVFYNFDLIHNLTLSGNWFTTLDKDHEMLNTLVAQYPNENLLCINLSTYQNAGANMIQQLAYALGHANEYLNHFSEINPTFLSKTRINFQISIGSNYFFEIAKTRALRWLYASLANNYAINPECHILAIPSKRNKTLYDYNVNMLRTTTECMSAVLGGANAVCNLPYDALYHKSNEFGERIARNQLLILKAESYFDLVNNPSEGSYYIESLTHELAQKALQLFKEIENSGGFLKQLKAGTIQKKIQESAQKEQALFDEGQLVLVGTNKFSNKQDRMKDDLELFPFVKRNPRKTIIAPIIERRLAEELEQKRLENE